jgi:hypothetical protein
MIQRPLRLKLIVFFAILLVIDWILYFRHIGHFFQGVYGLSARRTSALSLRLFEGIYDAQSFRMVPPLDERTGRVGSISIRRSSSIPYRIPVYVVFVAITIAVYLLAFTLTRRHLAAAIACTFFTIHTANAYTTYDVGFLPELLFTFFYVAGRPRVFAVPRE